MTPPLTASPPMPAIQKTSLRTTNFQMLHPANKNESTARPDNSHVCSPHHNQAAGELRCAKVVKRFLRCQNPPQRKIRVPFRQKKVKHNSGLHLTCLTLKSLKDRPEPAAPCPSRISGSCDVAGVVSPRQGNYNLNQQTNLKQ
jgi:hypothetical protein